MITGNAAAQKNFGSQYIGGANQWYISNLEELIRCQQKRILIKEIANCNKK